MTGETAIKPWGNSQGIILPQKILKELNWEVRDELELHVKDDTLYITKAFRHRTLEERLAAYKDRIDVVSFDWGEPVGKEML